MRSNPVSSVRSPISDFPNPTNPEMRSLPMLEDQYVEAQIPILPILDSKISKQILDFDEQLSRLPCLEMARFEFQMARQLYVLLDQKYAQITEMPQQELKDLMNQLNQIGLNISKANKNRRSYVKGNYSGIGT